MIIIGLISGTSADGIDAAVVDISGAPSGNRAGGDHPSLALRAGSGSPLRWRLIHHYHHTFSADLQKEILACASRETSNVARICALNATLGEEFATAALAAVRAAELTMSQIDLIGSHGQTVWHIPGQATLQIGEAAIIAERTGVTTISNFRARDVAAGGQGAPLVAYADVLWLTHAQLTRAAQNIGGIANVTFLPPHPSPPLRAPSPLSRFGELGEGRGGLGVRSEVPFAFDTGPGNMLIDYTARIATNGALAYDRDGALAARGRVDDALLNELLAHPFYATPPPKTTGRELYDARMGDEIWQRGIARGLRGEDIVATLTALTAETIARAYRDFLPTFPDEVILSGGGAQNPTLVAMLRDKLTPARVFPCAELGMSVEAKEAFSFALLAYETAHGRAGNLPAATGARRAVVLGSITPGSAESTVIGDQSAVAGHLTESVNLATREIDMLETLELAHRINAEDARVAGAVADELPNIARAVDEIVTRMRDGGRLIYVGAGTSGRLGILDAAEMPPTFSTPPELVVALLAGGNAAVFRAVEGAEDDSAQGARDVAVLNVSDKDSVVGLSASGRTPYVIGALEEARARAALTISVASNHPAPIQAIAHINIAPLVGAEVIAGSTRMKAGTAEKLVLNTISTAVMVRLGKTYGNLMVDLHASNAKLRARARRIVETACNVSRADAEKLLRESDGEVKTAIVAHRARVSISAARRRLEAAGGSVHLALTSSH